MRRWSLALTVLVVVFMAPVIGSRPAQAVSAGPIYIDFGTYRGSASGLVDASPATWNIESDWTAHTSASTLVDSEGHDTGFVLSITRDFDTGYKDTLPGGEWNDLAIPWSVGAATHDIFALSGAAGTEIVFSNLNPDLTYYVELISSRSQGSIGRLADYMVSGAYADVGGANGSNPFDANLDGYLNHCVMKWFSVVPDNDNKIELQLRPRSGNWSYVSAVKLEGVPEPATLSLLAMGGLGALWRRRRTR